MATQEHLAALLHERLIRAGINAATLEPEHDHTVVAVLRRFDVTTFAESALRFAAGLTDEEGADWLAALTRTAFLAGNPVNLRDRFPPSHLAADETIAWYGPAPPADFTGLRRLLKAFPAGTLRVPARVTVGEVGTHSCRLRLATAGLSTAAYLVHLNHTLAEALLRGLLRPGSALVIDHVPELADADLRTAAMIRVHRDTTDPDRLRAYTCLSTSDRRGDITNSPISIR
ncbi:DUF6182 family protein [Couchioplanes caeruleus]|uniref:Uncharacterized protein n=2 Tax=Couchioplanes caeruleus TaxID=56438 RepID=A0A1K0G1J1_9ACTN|nr:DUF6182 family protein [Couchioplanes caeruleus]OJF11170.1 hypothetical protein BG844_28080 [Couchioplanes caeruleus subsp. caeruleus]ROP30888.1 hypothetical protein EDD30_3764 [Couchioplanes caeruleus]